MSKTFRCDYCAKEKTVSDSVYKRSKNHFCSRECCNRYRLEMSKNNSNSDIITNYDVLVNKDIETLSKFLACISCKNNYKLQDYAECFKEWLKQKSINDKRCSDLYFKIPESYSPTEA